MNNQLPNKTLENSLAEADAIISRNYLLDVTDKNIVPFAGPVENFHNLRLFKLSMLVYNPEEDINDKLMTIYSALLDVVDEANLGLIIRFHRSGDVEFIFALASDGETGSLAQLFTAGFSGNFPGSEMRNYSRQEIEDCMDDIRGNGSKEIASLSVLPAPRNPEKEQFVQGIEKFIDAMRGREFTAVFIAEGIKREIAEIRKNGFEIMYSALFPFSKNSISYGVNDSDSVAESITNSTNQSLTKGTSRAISNGWSHSESQSQGSNSSYRTDGMGDGWSWGQSQNDTVSNGTTQSQSDTKSLSNTSGTSRSEGQTSTHSHGQSVNRTIESQNKTVVNMLDRIEKNIARLDEAETYGLWNCACYFIGDDIQTISLAANSYKALIIGAGSGDEESHISIWSSISENPGQPQKIQELFQYILHLKHPKFQFSYRKNDFKDVGVLINGKDLPLLFGVPHHAVPGTIVYSIAEFGRRIFTKNLIQKRAMERLSPVIAAADHDRLVIDYLSERYAYKSSEEWRSWLENGQVVQVLGEQRKVCSLDDRLVASGRLAFRDSWSFEVGKIFHMGNVENASVQLDMDSFTSHCFIAGSTGSGKSNTSYHILENFIAHNVPFLVIEPAKGEYKKDFGRLPGVKIFTTNQQYNQLLRLNPFRFHPNIHVLEHLDRLIEIFNVCWEMTPAVQAFLKNAMERIYIQRGWDLGNSICLTPEVTYPTLRDLLETIPFLIEQAKYSVNTKNDIEGALLTRIKTLTNGIFGQIFCSGQDIEDQTLFDRNVVVDLSRIGAQESKSLIMGILVSRLSEYRTATAGKTNCGIRHVTILEEAHNLLKNSSGNVSALVGKSVEMICNGIAEMRTYGEGFIIVDQSPTAVDISAIKNTNTKIIMRLPDQSDCQISGNAFGLNEYQIQEIPRLPQGVAIVMQNNWIKPVLTRISRAAGNFALPAIEVTPLEDIKIFRGAVVAEFFRQRDEFSGEGDFQFDTSEFARVISNLDIQPCVKADFVDFVLPQLKIPHWTNLKFGEFLLNFLNCKGAFLYNDHFIAQILHAADSEKQIALGKQWQRAVVATLGNFYAPSNKTYGKRIFTLISHVFAADREAIPGFFKALNKALGKKAKDI